MRHRIFVGMEWTTTNWYGGINGRYGQKGMHGGECVHTGFRGAL